MVNITDEFNRLNFIFDKTTNDSVSLPYSYDSVKIKLNTFATSTNINKTLSKLFYNFIFLYKNCNIADYSTLNNKIYSLSSVNANIPFLRPIQYTESFTDSNIEYIRNSNSSVLITNDKIRDFRYLILSSPTSISGYLLLDESVESVFYTTLVDTISGSISFNNISDIKCYDDDILYVVDSGLNNILKYDLSFLKTNENIYKNRPILQSVAGGTGLLEDRDKFNQLKKIGINKNILVAYDDGFKCLKIFDRSLFWINTIILSKFFTDSVNELTDLLLLENNDILCSDRVHIFYLKFSNNSYALEKTFFVEKYLRPGESIVGLNLSYSNKSIFYIVTNKSIKKFWVNQFDGIIGEYYIPQTLTTEFSTSSSINLKWMSNSKYAEAVDSVVLFALSGNEQNAQFFNFYQDTLSYNTILKNTNLNVYSEEDVLLKGEEYLQSWTIMKSFKKIMYNTYILAKNITYRFLENKNESYEKIINKIYNQSIVNFSNDFKFEDDFNIGVNEIFQAEVLNRVIESIINFQKTLLRFVINNKNTTSYLSPNPFRDQEDLKRYFYFVDESLILSTNPVILQVFDELAPGPGIQTSLGGAPYSSFDDISIVEGLIT